MMRIGNILTGLTNWMSRLDRMMSPERCCTNPYLATFLLYVFMWMGYDRDMSAAFGVIESLDDIYNLMLPQDQGMGIMCLIFLAAETIMLYGGIVDMLLRFVIIVVIANVFYVMGMYMRLVVPGLLIIIAIAYIYMVFILVTDIIRHPRDKHANLSGPEDAAGAV